MKAESPALPNYPVSEFTLGDGFPGFDPLPVVALDEETFVSRWRASPEEREEFARTGELYLLHPKRGPRFVPVRVQVEAPEFTLRVLALEGQGWRETCHGLEVTEAGGTEPDRVDYVAAEATELLVSRARVPCRVELLAADMPKWMEGGEEFRTVEKLEAGLAKRLRKALDDGEKRVEVRGADGVGFRAEVVEMTPRQIAEFALVSVPG